MKRLLTNLTFWVLIAILAAIAVGFFYPSFALAPLLKGPLKTRALGQEINIGATVSEFLAGVFISAVKLLINPIIFLTIATGIVGMGDLKKVGRVGAKALLYFEIVTTFALVVGVAVSFLIGPGYGTTLGHPAHGTSLAYSPNHFNWWSFL